MTPRDAGTPATWLRRFMIGHREGAQSVPCGACTACCRGGRPVEVLPRELERLRDVASPDGTCIPLGPDGRACSQLVDGKCAIYDRRPNVCRRYDCRLLLFTGIMLNDQPEVNEALAAWRSRIETPDDYAVAAAIMAARRDYLASPDFDPARHALAHAGEILGRAMERLRGEAQAQPGAQP